MTQYYKNGNTYSIIQDGVLNLEEILPPANYVIVKNPMTGELQLQIVDSFKPLTKMYGDTTKHTGRIINTFLDRGASTGVLLNGVKGSGKTLLAKNVSIEAAGKHDIPSILINQPWCGENFKQLVQNIQQPCIFIFDEFEKVYDSDQQNEILTLLDGVYPTKKLFILTCNDYTSINYHMINRPGRIFYSFEFNGLDESFIKEYCVDNLENKDKIDTVCKVALLFRDFNFDMLKAFVEEINRYGEDPFDAMDMLNMRPENSSRSSFDYTVKVNGKKVESADDNMWLNPLNEMSLGYYLNDEPADASDDVTSVDDDDNDDSYEVIRITPADLVSMNAQQGKYMFRVKNVEVFLEERKPKDYDFRAL